jgi:uncharacterized surface protein with fasciclin (FAS1) repeats
MRTLMRRALTPLAVVLLAACGAENDKAAGTTEQVEPSSRTLAATLRADAGFGTLGRIATNAGLTEVLDGVGPYTLFAPADAAFPPDAAPADVADQDRRAESAALLRAHVVPGALTRQDIGAALDGDADGSVQMRTMANTLVTFSREGSAIVVTSESGARGRLTGEERVARNGVMQPVDALLVPPAAPATPAA